MPLDINFEDSLKGLWIGRGRGAYLARFFPRLDVGQPRLLPLRPGMNVLYGRNGAGKTQTLDALAAAAQWQMGPLEGFILQDPTWQTDEFESSHEPTMKNLSTELILQVISSTVPDWWQLREACGFNPHQIEERHVGDVHAMLAEFQASGTFLMTRGLRWGALFDSYMWDDEQSRENLVRPSAIELIPVLLPDAEAPKTRAHITELRDSLRELLAAVAEPLGYRMDPEEPTSWHCLDEDGRGWREKSDASDHGLAENGIAVALEKWQELWGWSPLANARNLAYLGSNLDDHPEEYEFFPIHSREALVCLPPIHVNHEEYLGDFRDRDLAPVFKPFQEYEARQPENRAGRLRYGQGLDLSRLTREEIRERAHKRFEKETRDLKERLAFLPSYSSSLAWRPSRESDVTAELIIKIHGPYIWGQPTAISGSRAEVRWLTFAQQAQGQWLFLDEPEAGMHRTAEADLAATLASPVWSHSENGNTLRTIVVATHSPEFLSLPDANILHVDEGQARELSSIDRDSLSLLGLHPADLLSRIRTFLVVEGEHERIVFDALLGDEMRSLRVGIIVARGGKNMKDVFDSQVLFDFCDARIVALLDNIDANHVHQLWSKARDMAAVGQVYEGGELVRSGLPRKGSGENRFLANFLTRALEDGEHERVGAWGLSKEDIILYLPPAAFGLKRTWEEALSTYDPESDGSLKPWLTKKYGADFSLANVRAAAESLDDVPEDFTAMLTYLGTSIESDRNSNHE